MKELKYKIGIALIIMVWLFACNGGFAQTYNPAQGTVSNKPYAPAQATPTDSRSYFYDGTNFIWRPYQSTSEVLSYLNLSKYRVGNFSIFVNPTGTLNIDGTFTGGFIAEYWFKNGTANGNLVLKTDSTKANQQALLDTASAHRTLINTKQGGITLTTTGTSGASTLVGNTLNIPQYSGGGGSVNISAVTGTGAYVSPSPITGTGSVGIDTTKLATRAYLLKAADSLQVVPDTLVIKNSPTSGYGLAYPNLTNDTAFFKRLIQGYGELIVQNTDSSLTFKADTSTMSTILQMQKRLNDSTSALRNVIPSGGGISSVTAGINMKSIGSSSAPTLNYDPRINSNLFYNEFTAATLENRWHNGAPNTTVTFSSGHMRLAGGNATDVIDDSVVTITHRWKYELNTVIQSIGISDYFQFGITSTGHQYILAKIKLSDLSSTLYYYDNSFTLGTASGHVSVAIGDTVLMSLSRDNYVLTLNINNVTKGTQSSITYTYANVNTSTNLSPFRSFSCTMNPLAGTIDIDYAKLINQERKYADWLIVGHSIGEGFNATSPDSTYYNRLQSYFPDSRFAQYTVSSSKAVDFINLYKQDMLSISPKRVIIMLGINEVQAATPAGTFATDMRSLVDSLEYYGAFVRICNVTPYNFANKTLIQAYNTSLDSLFPGRIINIYDTLEYNGVMQGSTDSLHPNALGHGYMFKVMKNKIVDYTNIVNDPYIPYTFHKGINVEGRQSNFGITPLGLGHSGTNYPSVSYNVDYQVSNGSYKYKNTDYAHMIQLGGNGGTYIGFNIATSGSIGTSITWQELMALNVNGNLGLGLSAPSARLHIKKSQSGVTTFGDSRMIILDNTSGGVGQRQEIGMGYLNGNTYSPVVIGNKVTANSGYTLSDFYIGLRNNEAADNPPVEVFTIHPDATMHLYDTVRSDKRISYNSNVHGSFTSYSLIDKSYLDSVGPTLASGGSGAFSSKIRVVDNADITVASDDYTVVLKNSTTSKNVTIPSAASSTNRIIRIVNTGTSTIVFSIAVRVNGSTTNTTYATNTTTEIQSDGSEWWEISTVTR